MVTKRTVKTIHKRLTSIRITLRQRPLARFVPRCIMQDRCRLYANEIDSDQVIDGWAYTCETLNVILVWSHWLLSSSTPT